MSQKSSLVSFSLSWLTEHSLHIAYLCQPEASHFLSLLTSLPPPVTMTCSLDVTLDKIISWCYVWPFYHTCVQDTFPNWTLWSWENTFDLWQTWLLAITIVPYQKVHEELSFWPTGEMKQGKIHRGWRSVWRLTRLIKDRTW
jgi:hypothetical protein